MVVLLLWWMTSNDVGSIIHVIERFLFGDVRIAGDFCARNRAWMVATHPARSWWDGRFAAARRGAAGSS